MHKQVVWERLEGTPDYVSADLTLRAVYRGTDPRCGQAFYWTFPASLPKSKRIMRNALSVGGLPSLVKS